MFRIEKESLRAFVGKREVILKHYSDNVESEIEVCLIDLKGAQTTDFPDNLICDITPEEGFSELNSYKYQIYRAGEYFHFNIFIEESDGIWNDLSFKSIFREMNLILQERTLDLSLDLDMEEDCMFFTYQIGGFREDLYVLIYSFLENSLRLLEEAKLKLHGLQWKDKYLKDELLFTKEMVIPLLTRMGFDHVRYNHGVNEFGKDVLFSERDKFGNTRYLAAQVKSGNISGSSNGIIDVVVSQINDAFSMPVEGAGQQKNYYISEMYIICSGKFTENAVKKLNNQVAPSQRGSVFYIDNSDIEWLLRKHR